MFDTASLSCRNFNIHGDNPLSLIQLLSNSILAFFLFIFELQGAPSNVLDVLVTPRR